ncbi:hypothetical protein RB195_014229 [Necator americanus]|uniref:Uncharacterized protein n=1 Tax=Necator americanus TaxID=51031 RepID=A0ABR1E1V8_NECAM
MSQRYSTLRLEPKFNAQLSLHIGKLPKVMNKNSVLTTSRLHARFHFLRNGGVTEVESNAESGYNYEKIAVFLLVTTRAVALVGKIDDSFSVGVKSGLPSPIVTY